MILEMRLRSLCRHQGESYPPPAGHKSYPPHTPTHTSHPTSHTPLTPYLSPCPRARPPPPLSTDAV